LIVFFMEKSHDFSSVPIVDKLKFAEYIMNCVFILNYYPEFLHACCEKVYFESHFYRWWSYDDLKYNV